MVIGCIGVIIMNKQKRCNTPIPMPLMEELRKIRDDNHTTIIGAIYLLIKFYKDNQNRC